MFNFKCLSRQTDSEKTEVLQKEKPRLIVMCQALWFILKTMLTMPINTVMVTLANVEEDEKNPLKVDVTMLGFTSGQIGSIKICCKETHDRFMKMGTGPRVIVAGDELPEDMPPEIREFIEKLREGLSGVKAPDDKKFH